MDNAKAVPLLMRCMQSASFCQQQFAALLASDCLCQLLRGLMLHRLLLSLSLCPAYQRSGARRMPTLL